MRLEKAMESLQAAESCLALKLSNSCASRCYYAMFQAAVVALEAAGFHRDAWSHAALQATFTSEMIHRAQDLSQATGGISEPGALLVEHR